MEENKYLVYNHFTGGYMRFNVQHLKKYQTQEVMQDNTNMQNPDIIHQENTNDPLPSRPDNNYNTARTDNNVIPLPNETFSIPRPIVDVTSPSKMASPTATTSASTPKPTPTKPKPSDTPIIRDRIKVYWPKYKKIL